MTNYSSRVDEFLRNFQKFSHQNHQTSAIFQNLGREKNVEIVDLVKSFPACIWSQRSASIQPRTDRLKFEIEKWVSSRSDSTSSVVPKRTRSATGKARRRAASRRLLERGDERRRTAEAGSERQRRRRGPDRLPRDHTTLDGPFSAVLAPILATK